MKMTVLFTRKDFEALPEDLSVQLLDGVLVKEPTPTFGHQRLQSCILLALQQIVGPDHVLAAPIGVLVDEINVFEPDIVVLGAGPDELPHDDAQYVGVPLIVFEVLSPSTRRCDREYKPRRYLGLGVKEVWLVDDENQSIEVLDFDGARVAVNDDIARSRCVEGFELVPSRLFPR